MTTPPAGQPEEATVEQRHYDLVTKIFAPYCEIITEVLDNEAAQLIAASEARAVAEATKGAAQHLELFMESAELKKVGYEATIAELRAQIACKDSVAHDLGKALEKMWAALREAQRDSARLEAARLVALKCVAVIISFTPDDITQHFGYEYMENIFVAHRILANGNASGQPLPPNAPDAAALPKEGAKP